MTTLTFDCSPRPQGGGMTRIDDIRARTPSIDPKGMSLHERDRAFLLDLVERAEGILRAYADGPYRAMTYPLCGEWIDGVGQGHWCHLDRQTQWLRDVRGVKG